MNNILCFWRRRDSRIKECEKAIERQERMGEVIEWQKEEAHELSVWAEDRLRTNHLTEIFLSTRGRKQP